MTSKEDLKELKDAFLTIKQEWLEDSNVKLTEWQKNVFESLEKDLEDYEELIYLLSRTNKQITLNNRNHVQTLILDLSDLNPNIKQDIYKLIVKEK